jgi:hypothetical protein
MKTFEKQAIEVNVNYAERAITDYQTSVNNANSKIEKAEEFLKRKLTDDEKQTFMKIGFAFVMSELRKDFQFPNATDDFNLQAAGIDVSGIRQDLQAMPHLTHFDTEIVDGLFVVSQKAKDNALEAATVYTENEKQNKVFEIAKRLEAAFNELEDLELMDKYGRSNIRNITSIMHYPLQASRICINANGIKAIQVYE